MRPTAPARWPLAARRSAHPSAEAEAFDRLKSPAIIESIVGSASCGDALENATGCMGCSNDLASRVTALDHRCCARINSATPSKDALRTRLWVALIDTTVPSSLRSPRPIPDCREATEKIAPHIHAGRDRLLDRVVIVGEICNAPPSFTPPALSSVSFRAVAVLGDVDRQLVAPIRGDQFVAVRFGVDAPAAPVTGTSCGASPRQSPAGTDRCRVDRATWFRPNQSIG